VLRPSTASGRLIYVVVWLALAVPLPIILYTGLTGGMRGRDAMTERLGLWALRILIAGFALSPLARLLRRPVLHRYKRTVGLFGFTYAACHGVYYFFYGRVWEFTAAIWQRRLYISLGIAALALMVPLAVTSTDGMMRWMGPRAWRRLHTTFYGTVLVMAVHALWQNNIDYVQPGIYLALIVLLLIVRLPPVMQASMRLTARRRAVPGPMAKAAET
jgi:sulfoxide reductase heme-binding subunit YedZ